MRASLSAVAVVLALVMTSAQVRDTPSAPLGPATARISGVVVDDLNRPVRRALVRLQADAFYRSLIADTDGTFTFGDLAAGRYRLVATKPAYVTGQYGAKRPGRQGTPIVLSAGARLDNAVVTLPRGAVITGRIFNAQGEPAPGVTVRLLQSRFSAGGRTFQPIAVAGPGSITTDDRGAYRFFGLDPGEYLVSAALQLNASNIRLTTQADADRAEQEISSSTRARSASPAQDRPVAYAPVYYPGTISMGGATPITVGIAEERSGVDFRVDLVPTTTVEGTVLRPDGQPAGGISVNLSQSLPAQGPGPPMSVGTNATTIGPDGVFRFTSVIPGEYVVNALRGSTVMRTTSATSNTDTYTSRPQSEERMTATLGPILVTDAGVAGLTLTLRPGISVTGLVVFDGGARGPDGAVGGSVALNQMQAFRLDGSGRFTFSGVTPGRYLMSILSPSDSTGPRWTTASVVMNGRDIVDTGFEVTGNEGALDAAVTLTDRVASLGGVFQDAAGQPVVDYTIIVFTTDRTLWRWGARRIMTTRPSSDGKYAFAGLPSGEYFLTAVTDVEQNEWFDPRFLEQLVPGAIKLVVGDGEKKVQDIRVK